MNSNFSFIQIRNDGEDPIRVSRERLKFIKEFIEIEYYHIDSESHNFAISRNINSESYFRPLIIKKHDILITHDINVYRNTRSQDLDDIVVKYSDL
jgi:disulfide oxidoreductase YuzD